MNPLGQLFGFDNKEMNPLGHLFGFDNKEMNPLGHLYEPTGSHILQQERHPMGHIFDINRRFIWKQKSYCKSEATNASVILQKESTTK